MGKPIVFSFSGQGSQYYNMGKALYMHCHIFKKWMDKLDAIFHASTGESVLKKMYFESKREEVVFNQLLFTHPAIFMVEYSLAMELIENGVEPDYVLGSSLGEFTSMAVAGILDAEEVFELLNMQVACFERYCEKGAMLAVFGNPALYKESPILNENSTLISVNYDAHFVVAGKIDGIEKIKAYLKNRSVLNQDLQVPFAFHTNLIDEAEPYYKELISHKVYLKPKINIVSSMYGNLIKEVSSQFLWDIVRKPILFREALKKLESGQENIYLDVGPGGTCAGFIIRNLKESSKSEGYPIMTPYNNDLENLDKVKKLFQRKKKISFERRVKNMLVYVFPGQGSQQKGMGADLFDEFKDLTAKADEILGYSIKDLCINDPEAQLANTRFTQPSLYVVNALTYLKKVRETGKKPDYVAGHSLGEYNALFAAGVFDFETGLKLVKRRGELMAGATGGGMAAVIGLSEEKVEEILKSNRLESIDIANYNTPSQIVIAGPKSDIENAKPIFEAAGVRSYVVLRVSGAFHSRYMTESSTEYEAFLKGFTFSELSIPVISNVYARPYKYENIKKNLVEQIRNSVRWSESIRYIMGKGDAEILQIGPGNVLTGLVRAIQKDAEPLIVQEDEASSEIEDAHPILLEELPEKSDAVTEEVLINKIAGKKSIRNAKKEKKIEEHPVILENSGEEEKKTVDKDDVKSKGMTVDEDDVKSKDMTVDKDDVKPKGLTGASLGNADFKKDYNLKYAYLIGGMYRGIASKEMVARVGKAGMLGFLGTDGMSIDEIEHSIIYIQKELNDGQPYGMNLISNSNRPQHEERIVDLFLKHRIRNVEAASYISLSPAIVRYRLTGLEQNGAKGIVIPNRIIAKVSRPEIAEHFLAPAPESIVRKLLQENKITKEEAELSKKIPMADDLCVESDSGGRTDHGVAFALIPAIRRLRDEKMKKLSYAKMIRIGAAGGIGTPDAAAAMFVMGCDFILTGSINQCTVEAATSDAVKDLLQQANVQDTEYAPSMEMFEFGAKMQALKRSLFFPARANKLYELYHHYDSIEEIDRKTKAQIQEMYFRKSFDQVYEECKKYQSSLEIERAGRNPKYKMAMIFKWYFRYASELALNGNPGQKVDYMIYCGPAMGAFNQWVKGTRLEDWRNRHVDEIGIMIVEEAAKLLSQRLDSIDK
ncbi:MAG: ACP S-malonyltransferase [Bacillota bacterium]|nr:ACP S-malonyltransferase [Bacillota bacterium]